MSARFPFSPYPRGWYALCASAEVNGVVTLRAFGEDLVAWRAGDGRVVVSDAHCPHMGAHVGFGGRVDDGCLRCPFHGFRFDGDGRCVSTPYPGGLPPKAARLRAWPAREAHGLVLVYFDPTGAQPGWEVPALDTAGWTPLRTHTWTLRTHPQETTENSVDLGHFAEVHRYTDVEVLSDVATRGPYLTARYAMRRAADVFGLPGATVRTEFEVHVHGLGYSQVDARVAAFGLDLRFFVLPLPVDEGRTRLLVAMSARLGDGAPAWLAILPRSWAAALLAPAAWRGYLDDVALDIDVWENKRYVHPPALAPGDGPVGRYRAWARQFYAEAAPA